MNSIAKTENAAGSTKTRKNSRRRKQKQNTTNQSKPNFHVKNKQQGAKEDLPSSSNASALNSNPNERQLIAPTASTSKVNVALSSAPINTKGRLQQDERPSGSGINGATRKLNKDNMKSKANASASNSVGGRANVTEDDKCWVFQRNRFCRYGENCKYSHELQEVHSVSSNSKGAIPKTKQNQSKIKPTSILSSRSNEAHPKSLRNSVDGSANLNVDNKCKGFQRTGFCRFGENCKYSHELEKGYSGAIPKSKQNNIKPLSNGSQALSANKKTKSQKISSNNKAEHDKNFKLVCGICLEHVMTKPYNERFFGLLSDCNHVFCYSCIYAWGRYAQDLSFEEGVSCPVCRVKSTTITRSKEFIANKKEISRKTAANNAMPPNTRNIYNAGNDYSEPYYSEPYYSEPYYSEPDDLYPYYSDTYYSNTYYSQPHISSNSRGNPKSGPSLTKVTLIGCALYLGYKAIKAFIE